MNGEIKEDGFIGYDRDVDKGCSSIVFDEKKKTFFAWERYFDRGNRYHNVRTPSNIPKMQRIGVVKTLLVIIGGYLVISIEMIIALIYVSIKGLPSNEDASQYVIIDMEKTDKNGMVVKLMNSDAKVLRIRLNRNEINTFIGALRFYEEEQLEKHHKGGK